jgi:glyoxylase-like metal-dependent hydrolase (beta-lactamase superfamily II)
MVGIPLEDNFTDILSKAQRGLHLNDMRLAARARVSLAQLGAAKAGKFDDAVIRKLATALKLSPKALVASARQTWRPADPGVFITQASPTPAPPERGKTPVPPTSGAIDGLACFNTPFNGMTVNAYLVFDPQTRRAAVFDTGTDCDPMLKLAREQELKIEMILLTHTHGDHVYELDRLKEATSAKAYVSEREPLPGATPFPDGGAFAMGGLKVDTRRTSGHARGGTTFVVTGLPRRLAVVGDALFAGSMGGGMVDYEEALRTNREGIFTLPNDTIICPGHGPLTTVGEEKLHNPFFPEFQKQDGH